MKHLTHTVISLLDSSFLLLSWCSMVMQLVCILTLLYSMVKLVANWNRIKQPVGWATDYELEVNYSLLKDVLSDLVFEYVSSTTIDLLIFTNSFLDHRTAKLSLFWVAYRGITLQWKFVNVFFFLIGFGFMEAANVLSANTFTTLHHLRLVGWWELMRKMNALHLATFLVTLVCTAQYLISKHITTN